MVIPEYRAPRTAANRLAAKPFRPLRCVSLLLGSGLLALGRTSLCLLVDGQQLTLFAQHLQQLNDQRQVVVLAPDVLHLVALRFGQLVVDQHAQTCHLRLAGVRDQHLDVVTVLFQQCVDLPLVNHLAVADQRHQIEVDLAFAVLLDALVDDRSHDVQPVLAGGDGAQIDGSLLQAVQLVQAAIDRNVADKVVDFLVFALALFGSCECACVKKTQI